MLDNCFSATSYLIEFRITDETAKSLSSELNTRRDRITSEFILHSDTVQAINEEYVTRRRQFKKPKLHWRCLRGAKRSLGWIPAKLQAIRYKAGRVHYIGRIISLRDSYNLDDDEMGQGPFSEDGCGR